MSNSNTLGNQPPITFDAIKRITEKMKLNFEFLRFAKGGVIGEVPPLKVGEIPAMLSKSQSYVPRDVYARLVDSVHLPQADMFEDWSKVRSPSRARRRRKQGHRQNIKLIPKEFVYVVDTNLLMSPSILRNLRKGVLGGVESKDYRP